MRYISHPNTLYNTLFATYTYLFVFIWVWAYVCRHARYSVHVENLLSSIMGNSGIELESSHLAARTFTH